MIVVSDTSPINDLVLIEFQNLLPELFDVVLIPEAVRRELQAAGTPEPVRQLQGLVRGARGGTHGPGRGCARKNAHISLVASMPRLVGPTNHSGSGPPPGHVWPPSRTV